MIGRFEFSLFLARTLGARVAVDPSYVMTGEEYRSSVADMELC